MPARRSPESDWEEHMNEYDIGSSVSSKETIKKEDGLHAVSINIFHEQLGRHDMFFSSFCN